MKAGNEAAATAKTPCFLSSQFAFENEAAAKAKAKQTKRNKEAHTKAKNEKRGRSVSFFFTDLRAERKERQGAKDEKKGGSQCVLVGLALARGAAKRR